MEKRYYKVSEIEAQLAYIGKDKKREVFRYREYPEEIRESMVQFEKDLIKRMHREEVRRVWRKMATPAKKARKAKNR